MATHDYVIANGTGSAVRSDLNNALAAIVSNNSSSSEPSTKYAYQWWADTTTGQLKLRNSANNGWVTIFELDGTMLMEDGTVSAPGLAFASDLNTGIFRPGADQLNISTNGAERLSIGNTEVVFNDASNNVDFRVESNGNTHMLFVDGENDQVGIGTSSPSRLLDINNATHATLALTSGTSGQSSIFFADTDTNIGQISYAHSDNSLFFRVNDAERVRIDNSGRLLVGHSADIGNQSLQVVTSNGATAGLFKYGNNDDGSELTFFTSRNASKGSHTVVANGDYLGRIFFRGSDGSSFERGAEIAVRVDGTPGANDMPGRLEFYTTPDGSTTPSERMRIDSSGVVKLTQAGNNPRFGSIEASGDAFKLKAFSGNSSHNAEMQFFTGNNSPAERMRIDSSGRLLMGTSSSRSNAVVASKLQIEGTGAESGLSIIRNSSGNSAYLQIGSTGGTSVGSTTASPGNTDFAQIVFSGSDGSAMRSGAYITAQVDQSGAWSSGDCPTALKFATTADGASSPTERMRITSGGSLLLASRTSDDFAGAGTLFQDSSGGTSPVYLYFKKTFSGTRDAIDFRHSGTQVGSITFSNSNTAYNTSSDYRLKENIVDLTGAIARVNQLSPRRFNFIGESDTVDGFVAHEAQAVVPEAVHGTHNGVEVWDSDDDLPDGVSVGDSKLDENENTIPKYQGIDQSKLVPLLTAALQEAIAKIETLETKVAALEAG